MERLHGVVSCNICPLISFSADLKHMSSLSNFSGLISGRRAKVFMTFMWVKFVPPDRVTQYAAAKQLALPELSCPPKATLPICTSLIEKKESSARGPRGKGCHGYLRQYKWAPNERAWTRLILPSCLLVIKRQIFLAIITTLVVEKSDTELAYLPDEIIFTMIIKAEKWSEIPVPCRGSYGLISGGSWFLNAKTQFN